MRLMNHVELGLIALFLILFSSGCANKPCPASVPTLPPAVYLETVPEPKMRGRTNADLVAWALDLRQALRLANSDKVSMMEWSKDQMAAGNKVESR